MDLLVVFTVDESLPKDLRIYLVDRLNMKKEYDILMGRYPTLTIEQFINMEECQGMHSVSF